MRQIIRSGNSIEPDYFPGVVSLLYAAFLVVSDQQCADVCASYGKTGKEHRPLGDSAA